VDRLRRVVAGERHSSVRATRNAILGHGTHRPVRGCTGLGAHICSSFRSVSTPLKTNDLLLESGMGDAKTSLTQIEVVPATPEQEPVIANLLELYAHDFSEFADLKIGADGRFGYERLPLYWKESNRFPFLVRANGDLAGFVLVQQGSQISGEGQVWDIAEFFVLRGYRRHGVGVRVAHDVWRMFTGRWEVRVTDKNLVAQAFWKHAISEFTGMPPESALTEVVGKRWHVFSFFSDVPPNNSLNQSGGS
jgi:predicted acetyltransferase